MVVKKHVQVQADTVATYLEANTIGPDTRLFQDHPLALIRPLIVNFYVSDSHPHC